ncbi:MAG: acetyl-CoA carboxylase biotin carboxyl carrier protein subunit [Deltaproteobacteria bacterium]|nr:acetyl-CoA carboxylase biotin carboxyl carrier protein subunit [Deltaproteobacteria bacterium]NIS76414.1 acetyl-CoA carboxylase biotin carboxyl carrier protein subunit [Deltaproteobacteria bacterium]
MNYYVSLEEKEVLVGVTEAGVAQFKVRIDDREIAVDAHKVEKDAWSIVIDNRVYEADLVVSDEDIEVLIRGDRYPLKVLNEQKKALGRVSEAAEGGKQLIDAPMPGKVVKVLVVEGEDVEANQGVIIIEAMKMENEFKSRAAGKVKEVFVKEGDIVEGGEKLLLIE